MYWFRHLDNNNISILRRENFWIHQFHTLEPDGLKEKDEKGTLKIKNKFIMLHSRSYLCDIGQWTFKTNTTEIYIKKELHQIDLMKRTMSCKSSYIRFHLESCMSDKAGFPSEILHLFLSHFDIYILNSMLKLHCRQLLCIKQQCTYIFL